MPPPEDDLDLDFEIESPESAAFSDTGDDVFAVTPGERETPCSLISGSAGSGKTFLLKERIAEDPTYAIVSASTGIAAVNLNATTINTLLGYFDTDSLKDAYLSGAAQRTLIRQAVNEGYRNVAIDEISMISYQTLDLIVQVFDDVNANLPASKPPVGLILVGDHAQLPPISDEKDHNGKPKRGAATPWSFHARAWPRFERNTTRLTKMWRQSDARFLAALNHARAGEGPAAVNALAAAGAEFHTAREDQFDGTTIVPDNAGVDRHNALMLARLPGKRFNLPSRRWGRQRGEWRNIPERVELAVGAYVMLLANKRVDGASNKFEYVNGDCGHIEELPQRLSGSTTMPPIRVRLVRTGEVVDVEMIVRAMEYRDKPDTWPDSYDILDKDKDEDQGQYHARPHYRSRAKRYVQGQVEYYPVRLAFASTCHKIQGLSLDRVQIDFRHWMWSKPGMVYVAMSRARSIAGLRIVGMKEVVAGHCKCDPAVRRFL